MAACPAVPLSRRLTRPRFVQGVPRRLRARTGRLPAQRRLRAAARSDPRPWAPTVDNLAVKCQRDVIKGRPFIHIPGASFSGLAFVCAFVADTPDHMSVAQLLFRFTGVLAAAEGANAASAATIIDALLRDHRLARFVDEIPVLRQAAPTLAALCSGLDALFKP